MLVPEELVAQVFTVVLIVRATLVFVAWAFPLAATLHHVYLHFLKLKSGIRFEFHLDDMLHCEDKLDGVLIHQASSKDRSRRDYLVEQVSITVEQNPWHVNIQVVLNALSGNHLNELGERMLLGYLV